MNLRLLARIERLERNQAPPDAFEDIRALRHILGSIRGGENPEPDYDLSRSNLGRDYLSFERAAGPDDPDPTAA